mmetsp:Transcript_10579/g.15485  ORF Transcript_10579/g.15485 Transcript_10579/m.15485 type:complete len:182 (+) Transcript_10579:142-687(+)
MTVEEENNTLLTQFIAGYVIFFIGCVLCLPILQCIMCLLQRNRIKKEKKQDKSYVAIDTNMNKCAFCGTQINKEGGKDTTHHVEGGSVTIKNYHSCLSCKITNRMPFFCCVSIPALFIFTIILFIATIGVGTTEAMRYTFNENIYIKLLLYSGITQWVFIVIFFPLFIGFICLTSLTHKKK